MHLREKLIKALAAFVDGRIGPDDLELWVLRYLDAMAEADPETRKAFEELDAVLLARLVGEEDYAGIYRTACALLNWLLGVRLEAGEQDVAKVYRTASVLAEELVVQMDIDARQVF